MFSNNFQTTGKTSLNNRLMGDMMIFNHHIYEYKKGVRNLILHTAFSALEDQMKKKLEFNNIPYKVYKISDNKINIFFGSRSCIEIISLINKENLSDYTIEEDFILGIMLGYDRHKQFDRFINKKKGLKTELLAG